MLTIFSTPKPFVGHIGIIQRNAIQSWKLIHPQVEIILFGDEPGTSTVVREFGLIHVPEVSRSESGAKLLRSIFQPAQRIARHELLCYVNCDIILVPGIAKGAAEVASQFGQFLMVGRRWNVDITDPWDFSDSAWEDRISKLTAEQGKLVTACGIDYFAFRRGLYPPMPALVIGRIWWDHWLIWKARSMGIPVIDASSRILAIHQNHDYSYHVDGAAGVWNDKEALRNYELAGGAWHLYTIQDCTHELTASGISRNWKSRFAPFWRFLRPSVVPAWFRFLELTRPLRNALGLRKKLRPARVPVRHG